MLLLAPAGLATLVAATLLYKLSRFFTPLYFPGYKQLEPEERRSWDSRLGTMFYAAYIVSVALRALVFDRFFWKVRLPSVRAAVLPSDPAVQ